MKKYVIIFAGGKKDLSKDELQRALFECEITPERALSVIAADSGGDFAQTLGVTPKILIGDLDSISEETLSFFSSHPDITIYKYPQDKVETDLELALNKALSFNPESIFIFGAFGGRLDHELANISLCSDGAYDSAKIILIGKDQHGFILNSDIPLTLTGSPKDIFSLIPLTDEVTGVHITGSRWELHDAILKAGRSRSVCNEFLNTRVEIKINKGKVLVLTKLKSHS